MNESYEVGSSCHRGRFQLPPGTVPVATGDGSRWQPERFPWILGRFQCPPGFGTPYDCEH